VGRREQVVPLLARADGVVRNLSIPPIEMRVGVGQFRSLG